MSAPVVIVFVSDGGPVVRWYASKDQALYGSELASASPFRACIEGAPEDVAAEALEVHRQLQADRDASVAWVLTHDRIVDGLDVEIRPRRMARSESRRRTQMVALRLLPEEHVELSAAADTRGVSLSELLRGAALDRVRHVSLAAEDAPAHVRRLIDSNYRLVDDRARLTRQVELLLWLHAEALWRLGIAGEGWSRATDEAKRWGEIRHQHWLAAQRLRGELTVAQSQLASNHAKILDALGVVESERGRIDPTDVIRGMRDRIDELRAEVRAWTTDYPAIWEKPHQYKDNGSGEHGVHGPCRTCGHDEFDDLHASADELKSTEVPAGGGPRG